MWRVIEREGDLRRGTVTLCIDQDQDVSQDILDSKGIANFDDGARIEERGMMIGEPWEDQDGKKYPGVITMGSHHFEIMRELPVTAPKIIQHVVSAAVVPRIGDPKRRK